MRRHYAAIKGSRLRAIEHYDNNFSTGMLTIRIYISALTLLFLLLVIVHRGLGVLEAVVITCALVFLILDVRSDLQAVKTELRLLNELEKHVASLMR
jgi:cobalamin biosynthesis protein CobD/CbiB